MGRNKQSTRTPVKDTRLVEKPDGFYWQDPRTDKLSGPYATAIEAIDHMQSQEEEDYTEPESLRDMETEMGIAGWMDSATGEFTESMAPHLSDE